MKSIDFLKISPKEATFFSIAKEPFLNLRIEIMLGIFNCKKKIHTE